MEFLSKPGKKIRIKTKYYILVCRVLLRFSYWKSPNCTKIPFYI